jgi:hypothetical protein
MASKKRKAVTLEWMDENLWRLLNDPAEDRDKILERAQALINDMKETPSAVSKSITALA